MQDGTDAAFEFLIRETTIAPGTNTGVVCMILGLQGVFDVTSLRRIC